MAKVEADSDGEKWKVLKVEADSDGEKWKVESGTHAADSQAKTTDRQNGEPPAMNNHQWMWRS